MEERKVEKEKSVRTERSPDENNRSTSRQKNHKGGEGRDGGRQRSPNEGNSQNHRPFNQQSNNQGTPGGNGGSRRGNGPDNEDDDDPSSNDTSEKETSGKDGDESGKEQARAARLAKEKLACGEERRQAKGNLNLRQLADALALTTIKITPTAKTRTINGHKVIGPYWDQWVRKKGEIPLFKPTSPNKPAPADKTHKPGYAIKVNLLVGHNDRKCALCLPRENQVKIENWGGIILLDETASSDNPKRIWRKSRGNRRQAGRKVQAGVPLAEGVPRGDAELSPGLNWTKVCSGVVNTSLSNPANSGPRTLIFFFPT